MENIPEFKGLIKNFKRPVFTNERHNAVTEEDMIMTRWTNGKLLEVKFDSKGPYVEIDEKTKKYIDKIDHEAAVSGLTRRARAEPVRALILCRSAMRTTVTISKCIFSCRSP